MTALVAAERRALLLGLPMLALLLVGFKGVPWYRDQLAATRAAHVEALDAAARWRAAARRAPAVTADLGTARAQWNFLAARLLPDTSRSAASAHLVALVREASRSSTLAVDALTVTLDSVASTDFDRLDVRGGGAGDVRAVAAFLRAIEGAQVAMSFAELAIEQPSSGPADTDEHLRVQFRIVALAARHPGRRP